MPWCHTCVRDKEHSWRNGKPLRRSMEAHLFSARRTDHAAGEPIGVGLGRSPEHEVLTTNRPHNPNPNPRLDLRGLLFNAYWGEPDLSKHCSHPNFQDIRFLAKAGRFSWQGGSSLAQAQKEHQPARGLGVQRRVWDCLTRCFHCGQTTWLNVRAPRLCLLPRMLYRFDKQLPKYFILTATITNFCGAVIEPSLGARKKLRRFARRNAAEAEKLQALHQTRSSLLPTKKECHSCLPNGTTTATSFCSSRVTCEGPALRCRAWGTGHTARSLTKTDADTCMRHPMPDLQERNGINAFRPKFRVAQT